VDFKLHESEISSVGFLLPPLWQEECNCIFWRVLNEMLQNSFISSAMSVCEPYVRARKPWNAWTKHRILGSFTEICGPF